MILFYLFREVRLALLGEAGAVRKTCTMSKFAIT